MDLVAELAAATVTGALGSVVFGHGEVIGIVREYLDGLAESPLHDVFLRWAGRLPRPSGGEQPPPTAAELVEPDPDALRTAADSRLTEDLLSAGIMMGTDPE